MRARAKPPPGQLKPLIVVPTTAGTGPESTVMCVLDILSMRVKTGISHWRLRPTLVVIDPLLTMSLPPEVTAPAGYPPDEPMVPHGQSVSLTAPEAFRYSFPSAPDRHLNPDVTARGRVTPVAAAHCGHGEHLPRHRDRRNEP